jgi:hypothetical protein
MIISYSEMEKGLDSFNKKKLIFITHLIFVVKAKRDGGKTFFLLLCKKSHKESFSKRYVYHNFINQH